jgi:glutaconate CoA-transferase, subunit B
MVAATKKPPTAQEMMVVAAAREIRDREVVFVGMRLPLLAFRLAQATHARNAVGLYENGLVRARAAEDLLYTMSDPANVRGATSATELLDVMGFLQSGRVGVGFVGAAEVDRFGNLNTTLVSGKAGVVRLPGSGGASDIASLSQRLVVLLNHRRHRLVEKVHYVTSPGHGDGGDWRRRQGLVRGGPWAVITDRGVLKFDPATGEALLDSFHLLSASSSPEMVVAETGWPLRVRDGCRETVPPTEEELFRLRAMDPTGFWLGKDGGA